MTDPLTALQAAAAPLLEPVIERVIERVIDRLAALQASAQPVAPPALLDRCGLARELAISPSALDRLRGEMFFPELRVGDVPRFELAEVLNWLRRRSEPRAALIPINGGRGQQGDR